jgi:dGTPase
MEGQIANLADEIAYINHDIDDGLRSGLITLEQISGIGIFPHFLETVRKDHPGIAERRMIHETVRRMINMMVNDLIRETENNLKQHEIQTLQDVHAAPTLVAFSAEMQQQNRELKSFLYTQLYRHYRVMRMSAKAHRIISELFNAFMADIRLLPPQYQQNDKDHTRAIADYIAGMTDRYAIREHRLIYSIGENLT